ncbi:MAG: hypothetical protein ACR2FN_13705 [Chitinophagaceae bacterium]
MKRFFHKLTHWELWPFYIIYAPLCFAWIYYAVKAKAFWFFSPVNPTLEFSGFEGESKKEMYEQLPKKYYPATLCITSNEDVCKLIKKIEQANIKYPFITKPQVGMHALMFRKIENENQLRQYHAYMPFDYILQQLINLSEFSVFHVRYPDEEKGKITGLILKDYLAVTGDGSSALIELIKIHPKAKYREHEMQHKHAAHLNEVISAGEKYYLSIAGNHNRGARFINLHEEIDERLCNVFDKISKEAGQFYFGRYDLKCTSLEDLKEGKNIFILEYNGVGAEPNHIYDCGMRYREALKIIADHWKDMYRIGKINHRQQSIPYWSFWKGYVHLKKTKQFFKEMRFYDLNCPV